MPTSRAPLTLITLLVVPLLLVPAALSAQTEIPGTVTAVDGSNVTIAVPGDVLPRAGDAVRLRFRDPVPGAGLVFVEGTWEIRAVRRDEVDAVPRGNTAEPQEGLVAVITSSEPQAKATFAAEPETRPEPGAEPEEPAVAAEVHDRSDSNVQKIDRRRWFTISAGASMVQLKSPTFYDFKADTKMRPRLTASAGVHLLPNVALSGYLGVLSANGSNAAGTTQSAQEIYKGVGATVYFGTPGNVPGDVNAFVQGGAAWYDVRYGSGGGSPDATGNGYFGGVGAIVTVRRGFGLYVAGQTFTANYDQTYTVFDRGPVELNAGATVIF